MYGFTFYFLRWVTGWASILHGLLSVFSLGFWNSTIDLYVEKLFLDYCERKQWTESNYTVKNFIKCKNKE